MFRIVAVLFYPRNQFTGGISMKRLVMMASIGLVALSACASMEPEPCSTEWVEWKTDRVLGSFARQNRGIVNDLRNFSTELKDPGPLTLFLMASRLDEFRALAEDFQQDVMPELQSAVEQCGTPEKFIPAFTGFLRDEGIDEEMLKWIDTLGTLAIDQSTKS